MKKIIIGVTIASLVLSPTAFAKASGANLDIVRSNCNAARSTIQRIVSSDKTSRINRGRAYDRMSNLFINFSERLRQNNIDNKKFVEISNQFNVAAKSFRSNYDDYKTSIDSVINRECASRPAEFYEALTNAREKRRKVNDDINILNEIAKHYRNAVNELGKSLYGGKKHE